MKWLYSRIEIMSWGFGLMGFDQDLISKQIFISYINKTFLMSTKREKEKNTNSRCFDIHPFSTLTVLKAKPFCAGGSRMSYLSQETGRLYFRKGDK